jgi:hypothetical protein
MATELSRGAAALDELWSVLQGAEARRVSGQASVEDAALAASAVARLAATGELGQVVGKALARGEEVDPESGKPVKSAAYRAKAAALRVRLGEVEALARQLAPGLSEAARELAASEAARAAALQSERASAEAAALERRQATEKAAAAAARAAEAEAQREHERRLVEAAREVALGSATEQDRVFAADRRCAEAFVAAHGASTPRAVEAALALLAGGGDRTAARRALNHLRQLWARIVAHPESEPCRTINAMNGEFRALLAGVPGGREVLAAAGFGLHLILEKDAAARVTYVLPEPDLENEMDRWTEWFEFVKQVDKLLRTVDL